MNDNDYIRKAVEMANGFEISHPDDKRLETYYFPTGMGHKVRKGHAPQIFLDALAAQLVRQVESPYYVAMTLHHSAVMKIASLRQDSEISFVENEFEWAMNTIKVIIDSKVLK